MILRSADFRYPKLAVKANFCAKIRGQLWFCLKKQSTLNCAHPGSGTSGHSASVESSALSSIGPNGSHDFGKATHWGCSKVVLPDPDDLPSFIPKLTGVGAIAFRVSYDLGLPIFGVSLRA